MIIEDAELIEDLRMVVVELSPQRVTKDELTHLRTILKEHSGDKNLLKVPVLATVATPQQHQFVRFDSKYWVQDYKTAVNALNNAGFPARASSLIGS
jgi:DNA polymerase-3 subunit alpha